MRRTAAALALALALAAGANGWAAEPPAKTAPSFRLRALDGRMLDSAVLLGRGPVLLDFWATWCKPCITALPELQALHEKWQGRGLTVVGISEDGPRNFSKVRPFASRMGLTYAIALDEDGSVQGRYQVRALPTTVLIGTDGRIVSLHQGYRPGVAGELDAAIAVLLGGTVPDSAAADSTGTR